MYADFETIIKPLQPDCVPSSSVLTSSLSSSSTSNVAVHEPFSFGYYIKCNYNDSLSKYVSFRGKNASSEFLKNIREDLVYIFDNHLNKFTPMSPLTDSENASYISATRCHICNDQLISDKVRDHCHLSGKYRGPAHSDCNLNYKIQKFIPIFFHNLSGYDSHLFIKELWCEKHPNDILQVIPATDEKYISFSIKILRENTGTFKNKYLELRFLDSFRFLSSSLENLASSLKEAEFAETKKAFQYSNVDLILKKAIFPYEYLSSFEKLNESQLPSKEYFYSSISNSHISDEEYAHANNIWNRFNIKSLGEYSDIYLKIDVFLLTDIIEKFRNVCLSMYGLDPAHFYTLPGFSWSAMLKYTKVELELISDLEMIQFIKKGIRGGISYCSKRYAKANNKYMKEYDQNIPSSFLIYLDANNQYGWAMSQALPYGNFKWCTDSEMENLSINNMDSDENVGYILEVDIEYPKELHDEHNDYPFCAEKMASPISCNNMAKLIPNLHNKSRYIIYHKNLIQSVKHGLKLKHIHRALKFNQSCWLKKYIELNNR